MRTYLPITISKRFLYRLICLNLFFFLSYLIVNISEFWFVNIKINNIIFSQPDTCNYLLTSEWLIGSATPSSLSQNCSLNFFESKLPFITIRPFLYPTFLLLLKLFVNDQQYPIQADKNLNLDNKTVKLFLHDLIKILKSSMGSLWLFQSPRCIIQN